MLVTALIPLRESFISNQRAESLQQYSHIRHYLTSFIWTKYQNGASLLLGKLYWLNLHVASSKREKSSHAQTLLPQADTEMGERSQLKKQNAPRHLIIEMHELKVSYVIS